MTRRTCYVSLIAAVLILTPLFIAAQQYRLFERGWFLVREWHNGPQWRERSLWLTDYRVVIEARPIESITDLSALTYDPDRNSLFSVTNRQQRIIELALDGRLKRTIRLKGFNDPEAIEYIRPNTYVIADEREHRLIKVQLEDDTTEIDAADFPQLSVGLELNGNKGFEGLAYDPQNERLLVAKERDPVRIVEIHGFTSLIPGSTPSLRIHTDEKRDKRLFLRDLSSLDYDNGTGHLLVLSDESRLVIELDTQGKPISTLQLLPGQHGLKNSVPQAEGLATDNDGNLYLVSEPNLFYVFKKPVKSSSAP